MIEMKNIHKNYNSEKISVPILKDINLQIFSGEFIAIMGPSGSGKTTLMNILGLLDRPTSGHYYFENHDVTTLPHEELARLRNRTVGFIFQSFMLMPRMNLIENISLPLIYQDTTLNERINRSKDVLSKVGLKNFENRKPTELSGGQQQRVAIARALVTHPKIILADEPTGSLDSHTGQEIFNLLHSLNQLEKTTIVIVTHDITIANQCARVIKLHNGKIEENSH